MGVLEVALTHGGVTFSKTVLNMMKTAGWNEVENITMRAGEWASAPVIQRHPVPVDLNLTGMPLNAYYELPCFMMGAFSAQRNFSTNITEGVDYDLDRAWGRVRPKSGGAFDLGGGVANGRFTLAAGWEVKRGWVVLSSTGTSTQESCIIGARIEAQIGNPDHPGKIGLRWKLNDFWNAGSTVFTGSLTTVNQSAESDDVLQFIHPTADFGVLISATKDRCISVATADFKFAWCYIGMLERFRPNTKQTRLNAMMGNNAVAYPEIMGPVAKTNESGLIDGRNLGTYYAYDLNKFASLGDVCELNANYWTNEAYALTGGLTPSNVILGTPAPGTFPNRYFELHDAIAGRGANLINSTNNVIYGRWNGIKAVLMAHAQHNMALGYGDTSYRLFAVGDKADRYMAMELV